MSKTCDIVAERVALGEPLGEHAEHAGRCAACRGVVETAGSLGATHHAVDPGLGFAARMTVGAQHRIAVRRRRRIATGVAASTAVAALAVFVITRTPDEPSSGPAVSTQPLVQSQDTPVALDDAELVGLVQLADTDTAARASADWRHITKPLRPYKKLLQGIKP